MGLDRILGEVGITKTAFYKHFESKDELILAVLEERDRREVEEALAYMEAKGRGDPRARLLAFFDQLAEWFSTPEFNGCLFLNATTEFPSPHDPIHLAASRHGENLARVFLELAASAGAADPIGVTRQVMLMMVGAIAQRHTSGEVDPAPALIARDAVAVLLDRSVSECGRSGRTNGRAVKKPTMRSRR